MRREDWLDAHGQPKELGEVWRLRKGRREAVCVLQGHPIGVEARVLVDDQMISTKAFRESTTMINETTAWRQAFEAKGWTRGIP